MSSSAVAAPSLASTIPRNYIQTPKPPSYLLPLSISTLRLLPLKTRASFSPQPLYGTAPEEEQYEEEDDAIGDCLVYEEGIFDDPFLQDNSTPAVQVSTNPIRNKKSAKKTAIVLSPTPENLIPDKWVGVQQELNITKKERRKISREIEYGKNVEKRRRGLLPIGSEEYERFKEEKLQQLKPDVVEKRFKEESFQQLKSAVLDKPQPMEIKNLESDEEDEERGEEVVRGRVTGRNPRLAVYGVSLEDVSELFNSGRYDPSGKSDKKGSHKLFTKEEKMLMNKRVPDLAVATSGKWHPLHALAAAGEFYLVNSLLKHNLDINAPDKDGWTAVHRAILGRKQAIFNFLLRESANPFVRDEEEATLLHYAVFSASSQMIKILLLYNVDINRQDNDGWTALHLAVQSRRTDIVRLLLIKGADRNLKNRDGLTPLELCLYSGRDIRTYELIKLLKQIPKRQ